MMNELGRMGNGYWFLSYVSIYFIVYIFNYILYYKYVKRGKNDIEIYKRYVYYFFFWVYF